MAFYRIKEASEKVGVVPHVLRFWETQFPMLKPPKTSRGQRLYNDEDIENFKKIKYLLYNQGYSISGAKKYLKEQGQSPKSEDVMSLEFVKEIREELQKINQYVREI